MEDQLWQRGTNYGTMDGPAGPTKALQVVRGPPAAVITGLGGTSCGVTVVPS